MTNKLRISCNCEDYKEMNLKSYRSWSITIRGVKPVEIIRCDNCLSTHTMMPIEATHD
jgi:hypothetical protein